MKTTTSNQLLGQLLTVGCYTIAIVMNIACYVRMMLQFEFEGIQGCGLPCRDPLYTEDEHQQIHRLVAWGAGICLALNLLTVATFLIDWRSANKYPALVIFYINVCFAVASMG